MRAAVRSSVVVFVLGLGPALLPACGGGIMSVPPVQTATDAGLAVPHGDAGSGWSAAGGGDAGGPSADGGADSGTPSETDGGGYDALVLRDGPVAFWRLSQAASRSEPDLSGNGHVGTYQGGVPASAAMPNGDAAADFNGLTEYLTVPSSAAFSVPTTGTLTWEAWIRPDVLQFSVSTNGYVDYLGKCQDYSPTCEWEARIYNLTNAQNRPSRLSAYVFNPTAGLGSAADWQPQAGVLSAGSWYHVVGEYQTVTQPAGCSGPEVGGINIWVNGVPWNMAVHAPTGCMSQYHVTPRAGSSPLNIGTLAFDSWFKGAIGKVAIYGYLLTPQQIAAHYQAMSGKAPTGSCTATCSLGP